MQRHDQRMRTLHTQISGTEHIALKVIAAQTQRTMAEIVSMKIREVIAENRPHFLDEPQITL